MVKTLPTVERSTKIRFGRHTREDQGENSIVLNASNTAVDATEGGAVYITPVRFDDTYAEKNEIVLMMYNRNTKEMVESGEPASTLISDVSLQNSTTQGNVTSNSMIFYNNAVAFVTSGNVGISNALASHTLSVGSNLYVDDYGTNVLVVSGGVGITDTTTSTSATTGALKVAGGISTEENLHIGGVAKVHGTTASDGKTAGALIVAGGVGVSGALFGAAATLDGVVTLTNATESTSSTTGALKAAGGVGIAKDVYVGERAYVTGGLITNTGGLGRKTYSLSNSMPASVSPTTNIHFTSNIFYAKITATLVDRNEHVSTILLDVNGGSQAGSINSGSNVISVGNQTIFGTTDNATPWASNVSTTANTVALYTSGAMAVSGNVHVFVEYMSPTSGGGVHAIAHNGDALATFGY